MTGSGHRGLSTSFRRVVGKQIVSPCLPLAPPCVLLVRRFLSEGLRRLRIPGSLGLSRDSLQTALWVWMDGRWDGVGPVWSRRGTGEAVTAPGEAGREAVTASRPPDPRVGRIERVFDCASAHRVRVRNVRVGASAR